MCFLQFSNLVTVAIPLVHTAPPNMLCSAPVGIFLSANSAKSQKGASPVQCLHTTPFWFTAVYQLTKLGLVERDIESKVVDNQHASLIPIGVGPKHDFRP